MPKVPTRPLTISQNIETQLPDFVREDFPKFIAFLKSYYEWMEQNGADVYGTKILDSGIDTVTLQADASPEPASYIGMSVVVLNGPQKGHTRPIHHYDPINKVVQVFPAWSQGQVPPVNTRIVIRDTMFPNKLLEYRDIDETLDRFIDFFRSEFMYQIPGTVLADKRNILKHIKQFYQARGTENSFRFLFRILFNTEIEFYYPKVDVFRTNDARWVVDKLMRIDTTNDTFNWTNRQIMGVLSGAKASVEAVQQHYIAGHQITDLYLSNIDGVFGDPDVDDTSEKIKITYPFNPPPQTNLGATSDLLEPGTIIESQTAYLILQSLPIQNAGFDYQVGDLIDITGGGGLAPAKAYVSSIFTKFYNGGAQEPPSTFYLEPYWGGNDVEDNDDDPLNDAVAIPGLYYFDDVRSDITDADLLTPNEIILASGESDQDDFFAGDVISLTSGAGIGQQRTILSYNGTTKIATVDVAFSPPPNGTTRYSILHNRGGIKAVTITDFGLGFVTPPTITIHSTEGHSAVLTASLGLVGAVAGRWVVGRDGGAGGAPTTPDSFTDSNKVIQDSFYWQDFSYDLRLGETIDKYRDVVKTLLHPAGFKMFGSVWIKSKPDTSDFLKLLNHYITIEIDVQAFEIGLTSTSTTILQIQGEDAAVIGAKNEDLDGRKFLDFPPNVNFNLFYPFPNQDYWSADGPGNTQIEHFKNTVIGHIINFPKRRTKIAPDSYIQIQNSDFTSFVGTVGPNLRTLARGRFFSFPPFEGFGGLDIPYPAPNDAYWTAGFGNTQIKDYEDILIGDVVIHPETHRSNLCVDSTMFITNADSGIPPVGDIVEYSYLPGIMPNVVYNVSPNSHDNLFDGLLDTDEI